MNKNRVINKLEPKIKNDLQPLFSRFSSVLSAYIFGSAVQSTVKRFNDVDIAVRVEDGFNPEQTFDLRLQLNEEFENYFGMNVDIVVLNLASLTLIHQVLRNGKLIFAPIKRPLSIKNTPPSQKESFFAGRSSSTR
ncbi:MAG: nucleotidyltransferase domain-containing protein [Deltaproteobacteria bacterium]|jgi:predicted nucleotidyltransferase|nr:nucleotidyltransferase domain-containing protein [Deltaproteobacteria bacterium]MBW2489800.1 nucleotidyltransferase domain-containing protein [Deltaproteobacteria bacterium]